MKFKNVVIQSLAAIEPPIRVTSKEIEKKLKPTLNRLGVRDDLLEDVSGIGARRFWEKGTAPSDAATLAAGDLVASERRARERIGELELVCWNPAHCWYYYPAMQRNEVLLIKTFDAATDGRARRSIHSAFDNPQAPPDAPARESIESRLLVFFD